MHYAQPEEHESDYQSCDRCDANKLKRQVAFCSLRCHRSTLSAFHLLGSQSHGILDDAPRTDDANDTSHGDTTDTNAAGIGLEDLLRRHGAYCRCCLYATKTQRLVAKDQCHTRHDEPPYSHRTQTDIHSIFQSDDIAQAQHSSRRITLKHQLRLVGQHLAPANHTTRHCLVPPAKGSHDEVIETAHQACYQ